MEFRILGPLEVAADGAQVDLGGARQQVVLATLLLSAGRVVTVDRLLEAVYGQDLPPTSRSQVQISISALRRLLAAHGSTGVISTRPQGYVLQAGEGGLDSTRFADLAAAARAAREAGHAGQAVAGYRDALRLWRGPALEGIDSHVIRAAAARLDEQRITVHEDLLELELGLGRHHELVGELAELVSQFPLRERLRGQLMLALYRCGRTAEALTAYQQARQHMIDELGLEPGPWLQRVQQQILTADPSLDLPPAIGAAAGPLRQPPPSLLPADIADFIDRGEQISEIQQHLIHPAAPGRLAVPVVVLVGRGGVGKTSLAVHAAHGVAGHFRDGQLFADLHGGSQRPVGPMKVLERFLRVLGVTGSQLPGDLDERAELYRNLLAGRRMLVVLDDAAGEDQALPLLPGSDMAAVLVTSRRRLAALPGAVRVEVDVLGADHSLSLLDNVVGGGRVRAQAGAAQQVAGHCGYLPLALRIAGARLAARPHWSVGQLAERLADETRRLDELSHGHVGVRASISLSYLGASGPARRLLRLLALLEAPDFTGWLAAALGGQPVAEAGDLLDELVAAHLIDAAGEPGRLRFHDLVRAFARERLAAEETGAGQQAALERALGALLHVARQARRRYAGSGEAYLLTGTSGAEWPLPEPLVDELVSDPMSWYERERATLIAGIRQAARAGRTGLCWGLTLVASDFLQARAYFDDWQEIADITLDAASSAGDARGQGAALYTRGGLRVEQARFAEARRDLDAAAARFRQSGDEHGYALATCNTGLVDRLTGRLDDATRRFEQSLGTFRRVGDDEQTAHSLHQLAQLRLQREQPGSALVLLREALSLARAAGSPRAEAQSQYATGEAHLQAGEPGRAVGAYEQSLAKVRAAGDVVGEAVVLQSLGVALLRLGRLDQARDALQRARELAAAHGQLRTTARVLLGLSELALATADPGQAADLARQASAAFATLGTPRDEARALILLSRAHAALGDQAAADTAAAQAAALLARGTAPQPAAG